MQLGFVSAILPELSLWDVLSTAAQTGYDCVELMCWPQGKAERRYAGVTHLKVEDLDQSDIAHVHELLASFGLSISGLGYYPNPLSPLPGESESAIQHLEKVIDACDKLGIRQCNTFIGRDWTKSVEANWPRFLEVWKPLIQYAEEREVRVGIENCPMIFTDDEWPGGKNLATSPLIWRRMFNDIASDFFGLNYDPSHLVWQQMDYILPLREFKDRLFHIHAKDVRVDRDRLNEVGIMATPLQYHSPKLPGLGEVNWGRFFSVLSDLGYAGPVCVEVEDRAYEGSLAGRKSALRQSATYLRNYIPTAETSE